MSTMFEQRGYLLNEFSRKEFVREKELLAVLPFSRSTLRRWVLAEDFPAPIRIVSILVWRVSDVLAWFEKYDLDHRS